MPKGVYKRTKKHRKNQRQSMLGKHWKVKDTSKMKAAKVGK